METIKESLIKKKVQELYAMNNVWYIDDSKIYSCYHQELLEFEKMSYPKNGNLLLEIGAGRGRILMSFAKRYRMIIAVDISEKMLSDLKNKCAREKVNNVYLVRGDAENLPFKDNIFELVLAPEVIGHCPNPNKLVLEMIRMIGIRDGIGILSTAANYLSLPGLVGQAKSSYNCFLKPKNLKVLFSAIKSYLASSRKFWLYQQGYCRDSFFSIRKILRNLELKIEKVSGAGILPAYLSMRADAIEKLSIFFPFKFFSRVIIVSFKNKESYD